MEYIALVLIYILATYKIDSIFEKVGNANA